MPESASHTHETAADLPETVYLVKDELQGAQVKFHVYVSGSYTDNRYGIRDECIKPRCGQDGRRQYDKQGLIEVSAIDLINHLLPGMCRRCLNYLDLPQPTEDVFGGEILMSDSTITIFGGDTVENTLPITHPYREGDSECQ